MVNQPQSLSRPIDQAKSWQTMTKSWRFVFIFVLVIGILFRFTNLEQKPYWWDEVTNSIHSAGYSKKEFGRQIAALGGRDLTLEDIHRYQYPDSQTTYLDVIKGLADGEPQSPPVYYLLSRWWTQLFGSSITVQRSLSAVISLLAFPSMYWLCLELFGSSLAAGIGVMLLAISPFHLIFAQEVRMYVLWTVTVLASSASLLGAIRLQRKRDWAIYTASLILSLYTFPFSVLVAISHGIYVVIIQGSKFFQGQTLTKMSKTFFGYLISAIASVIAYIPWIVSLTQIDDTKMAAWRQMTLPFVDLVRYWLIQTSLIFADLNPNYRGGTGGVDSNLSSFYQPVTFIPMVLVWGVIIYALYFLLRYSSITIWSFILPLILIIPLTLVLPDLISGGMRSTVARYLIPSYLGIQLSVVNLIYYKLQVQPTMLWGKKIWQFIFTIFLLVGIISCATMLNSPSWWNKSINDQNIPITKIINDSENPLILTPKFAISHLISISHNLNNQVRVRLVGEPEIDQISTAFSDKFLLNYPQEWLEEIKKENKFKIKKMYQGNVTKLTATGLNFSLVRIERN